MKEKVVSSAWLEQEGRRLDCGPYLSGAIEAKVLLEKLPVKKEPLHTLTCGRDGGIYNGPQFVRNYVSDPAYGVPFLTSSSMLLADLSHVDLLRRKDATSPRLNYLRIEEGMTLISCSGTIGRMVYARPEMAGMWSSQDILKVAPDPDKIRPGYLYAFISSRFGVPIVISDEYGSVQRHIEPVHIARVPVPRLSDDIEKRADVLVREAAGLRGQASSMLREGQRVLKEALGALPSNRATAQLGQPISSRELSKSSRFEAFFHNPTARAIDEWLGGYNGGWAPLGQVANVFDVAQFKHIYVAPAYGVPFFPSGDLFALDRRAEKFLSKTVTKDLDQYILERGWILLARSGQIGGIIGRLQFVDSALQGTAASDHVIRIVADTKKVSAGFLFIYLSLDEVGYPLLIRTATGASIPALWPAYLEKLRVPLVSDTLMEALDSMVVAAFEKRVAATAKEDEARELVTSAIMALGGV